MKRRRNNIKKEWPKRKEMIKSSTTINFWLKLWILKMSNLFKQEIWRMSREIPFQISLDLVQQWTKSFCKCTWIKKTIWSIWKRQKLTTIQLLILLDLDQHTLAILFLKICQLCILLHNHNKQQRKSPNKIRQKCTLWQLTRTSLFQHLQKLQRQSQRNQFKKLKLNLPIRTSLRAKRPQKKNF